MNPATSGPVSQRVDMAIELDRERRLNSMLLAWFALAAGCLHAPLTDAQKLAHLTKHADRVDEAHDLALAIRTKGNP